MICFTTTMFENFRRPNMQANKQAKHTYIGHALVGNPKNVGTGPQYGGNQGKTSTDPPSGIFIFDIEVASNVIVEYDWYDEQNRGQDDHSSFGVRIQKKRKSGFFVVGIVRNFRRRCCCWWC